MSFALRRLVPRSGHWLWSTVALCDNPAFLRCGAALDRDERHSYGGARVVSHTNQHKHTPVLGQHHHTNTATLATAKPGAGTLADPHPSTAPLPRMKTAPEEEGQSSGMQLYKVGRLVGRGNFGMVHLCRSVDDGRTYVMKRINMNELSSSERKGAEQEVCRHLTSAVTALQRHAQVDLLKRLRHPCIVSYRDSFVEDNTLHVIMSYCDGGDLATKIKNAGGKHFSEDEVLGIFVQVLNWRPG